MSAPASPPYGLIAEFDDPERLARAARDAKAAGYVRFDVFTPYSMRDLGLVLGYSPKILPWIAAGAGLVGALVQYGAQVWMNAVDYPINVGGRPLHAWPTFIPATIIVAILWTGAATLLGMLLILRLPRLNHPVFAVEGFARASQDRFFLLIHADDPAYEAEGVARFLAGHDPLAVREVAA